MEKVSAWSRTFSYSFNGTGGCGDQVGAGLNGNRTNSSTALNGGTAWATQYCYDNADRLGSDTVTGAAGGAGPVVDGLIGGDLVYDGHGNTTTFADQTLGYDAADQHVSTACVGLDRDVSPGCDGQDRATDDLGLGGCPALHLRWFRRLGVRGVEQHQFAYPAHDDPPGGSRSHLRVRWFATLVSVQSPWGHRVRLGSRERSPSISARRCHIRNNWNLFGDGWCCTTCRLSYLPSGQSAPRPE